MRKDAIISDCKYYRYDLWRIWDDELPPLIVVGLNPSTADATLDDPTIRKCIGFAKRWGFGALCMLNLYAFRSTYPRILKHLKHPVGPSNDFWLKTRFEMETMILCAWGNNADPKRVGEVLGLIPEGRRVMALKVTKKGQPQHPLYVPYECSPVPYRGIQ